MNSYLTHEKLILQILSTCLLINSQEKWHAFFELAAHIGMINVGLAPSDHDYQSPTSQQTKYYKSRRVWLIPILPHKDPLSADETRQSLNELLVWTQGYLKMEGAV